MKRVILALFMIVIMVSYAFGQTDHGYNLYGQFFGNSTGLGIGLDSRFKPQGVLGYSAGVAFTNISWSDDDGLDGCYRSRDVDSKGLVIPLEVNATMGKRASKFELGIGVTTYLIQRNEVYGNSEPILNDEGQIVGINHYNTHKKVFRPNVIGTLNIGYRLQRKSGFFMKLGVSLLIGDLKCSPIDGVVLLPNICLGCTIPHF